MVEEDPGCIGFGLVFACVVGKNPKTPKLSPMADDSTGQYRRSGIAGIYLIIQTVFHTSEYISFMLITLIYKIGNC